MKTKTRGVAANTEAATADKITPITVSIGGDIAEKLRAEAQNCGLIPLSLVKQRLRLGNLLTDDTAEAREFRMDVAEKAFRDAGRYLVPQSWDPADIPAGCIMTQVRPCDARRVREWARSETAPEWIIAGVFAEIGSQTLCDDDAAESMDSNPTACLWHCILREEELFSETIPVFFGDGIAHEADTAKAMRRDMGDWLGSLIKLGADVMTKRGSLGFMTKGNELSLLAKSAELESIKQALAGGIIAEGIAKG